MKNSKSCMSGHNVFLSTTPGPALERSSGTLESLTGAAFCSALNITTEWSGAHRDLQVQYYLWRSFRGLSIELCELLIIPHTPKLIPNTRSCPTVIYYLQGNHSELLITIYIRHPKSQRLPGHLTPCESLPSFSSVHLFFFLILTVIS